MSPPSTFVTVRIPREMLIKIDALAKAENNPRSAVIRRLLSIAINELEKERR